jgi:hypothetical protein
MQRLIGVTLAAVVAGAVIVDAGQNGKGPKPKEKANKHATAHNDKADTRTSGVAVHIAFGTGEVKVIREHYAPRYRNLPPGLQKKVARGGTLPPGWQKKLEPFPVVLERQLPPLAPGYRRGVIDGHAVIYRQDNHTIIDVAVLF